MARDKGIRKNAPHYEVWRFVNEGYRITKRSTMSSADDTFVAKDLTSDEMWAMLKLIEQPCIISIATEPYHRMGE